MRKLLLTLTIISGYACSAQSLTKDYLDSVSNESLSVSAYHGSNYLWSGTAFIFQTRSTKFYLVTNNHIIGAEYQIWQYRRQHHDSIPPTSMEVNKLVVRFYGTEFNNYISHSIPIHQNSVIKFWADDAKQDSSTLLDVVAIPVDAVNIPNLSRTRTLMLDAFSGFVSLYPGLDLFVVGYPVDSQGYVIPTPIWKKGSIASEPNLISIGNPRFLIDATTRGGMSGSPVYFRGQISSFGENSFALGSVRTSLVGIYSAQYPNLELGVVTRLDRILKTLDTLRR